MRGRAKHSGGRAHKNHAYFIVQKAPSGVYFGCQCNPQGVSGKSSWPTQESETETVEGNIGRYFAVHNLYRQWSDVASITSNSTDAEISGDISHGRVPVIALQCFENIGGANYNLEQIASGSAYNDLVSIRNALANLQYPPGARLAGKAYPIVLRWFWEFNLNITNPPPNPNNNNGCFTADPLESPQTQFINAWNYIRNVLDPGTGIPNVTFMWNPTVAIAQSDIIPTPPSPDPFYPGVNSVDWIAFDGYSKYPTLDAPNPNTFNQVFDSSFNDFSGSQWGGKPISITETGACKEYLSPNDQATYLRTAETQIDFSSPYDAVTGAFLYFDAPGQYQTPQGVRCHWYLDSSGLTQFGVMGADLTFSPFVSP